MSAIGSKCLLGESHLRGKRQKRSCHTLRKHISPALTTLSFLLVPLLCVTTSTHASPKHHRPKLALSQKPELRTIIMRLSTPYMRAARCMARPLFHRGIQMPTSTANNLVKRKRRGLNAKPVRIKPVFPEYPAHQQLKLKSHVALARGDSKQKLSRLTPCHIWAPNKTYSTESEAIRDEPE